MRCLQDLNSYTEVFAAHVGSFIACSYGTSLKSHPLPAYDYSEYQ